MSISKAILDVLEQSSWIRKMFEEGIQLKKEFGEKNIFDLSLGNPLLEPPEKFKKKLIELSNSDEKGLHRYMPNQGFQSTREKVANSLAKESNFPITADGKRSLSLAYLIRTAFIASPKAVTIPIKSPKKFPILIES